LTADLFERLSDARPSQESMAEGAVLLHGFAEPFEADLIAGISDVVEQAPFRHMVTPGGYQMSVAMTNCGGVVGSPIALAIVTMPTIPKRECGGRRCRHRFAS